MISLLTGKKHQPPIKAYAAHNLPSIGDICAHLLDLDPSCSDGQKKWGLPCQEQSFAMQRSFLSFCHTGVPQETALSDLSVTIAFAARPAVAAGRAQQPDPVGTHGHCHWWQPQSPMVGGHLRNQLYTRASFWQVFSLFSKNCYLTMLTLTLKKTRGKECFERGKGSKPSDKLR